MHLKMAGVAGCVAGMPHVPDDLTGGHGLPGHNGAGLHVGVQRDPAQTVGVGTVVDLHKIAPAVMLLRGQHNTVRGGVNLGALGGMQVVAPVAAVLAHEAGNVFVLHRAGKPRTVGGVVQCRQCGGGHGCGRLRGRRCRCRRCSLGSGGGRLRRGVGCLHLRAHHAGRHADAHGHGAERQRPRAQTAVVQQVHNALLHAALPEGKTSGCSDWASLHGKMQQALTVGAALGQRAALHGCLVAGGLHVMLKGAQGQPRQRIEPVQADDGIKQRLHQWVAAADVGPLMQQHSLPRRALQAVRQVDARAHKAQCERRGHARPAVAAVGRFAGQRHTAL